MANRKSLTEQSFFLIIGRCAAYVISIVLPIILVRIFTKEEYGLYAQIFLIFNTLFSIGQMGVSQSLYYFLPRCPEKKHALMTQTFIFVTLTGAFALIGLLIFGGYVATAMSNEKILQYITLLGLYSFFMIGSSFLETSMIAEGKADLASVTLMLSQIVNSGVLVVSVVITRSLFFLMCGAILFSLSRFVVQCLYLVRKYRISLQRIDFNFWKEQLLYAIPIGLGNVSWLLQTRLHQYFVSYFFNPQMFAVYSVGCFKLPILNIVTSSVGNVMIPAISRRQKDGDKIEILTIWNNAIRKMNLFLFPAFVFFFIMAHEFIVLLFTSDYVGSIPIFRISLLAILISGINTGAVLQAYAETKYMMKLAFIRLPVTAGILYYFVNMWGVLGAVAADVLLIICFRIIVLGKVHKTLDLPFLKIIEWKTNAKIFLVAVLAGFPLILLKILFPLPPLVLFAVAGLLYSITYFFISIQSNSIHRSEIEKIHNYLNLKLSAVRNIHEYLPAWRK